MSGSYNQEIHEMTEARAFGMGQYGHNNQPVQYSTSMVEIEIEIEIDLIKRQTDRQTGEDPIREREN